ncbi:MAG: hypothetical protein ACLVAU_13470 [Ruminococcus sp.]
MLDKMYERMVVKQEQIVAKTFHNNIYDYVFESVYSHTKVTNRTAFNGIM